jgi:hypothetical protein
VSSRTADTQGGAARQCFAEILRLFTVAPTQNRGPLSADAVEEVGFELAAVAEAGNGEKTDDARHETARAT